MSCAPAARGEISAPGASRTSSLLCSAWRRSSAARSRPSTRWTGGTRSRSSATDSGSRSWGRSRCRGPDDGSRQRRVRDSRRHARRVSPIRSDWRSLPRCGCPTSCRRPNAHAARIAASTCNSSAASSRASRLNRPKAQLELITAPLAAQSPDWFKEPGMSVRSLHESLVGRVRSWMLLLFGMVAFVLLLACVNVANLMLARATARERDLGIRAALGASRWRIARGLLIESLVLSSVGTAIGLVVAWMGVEILRSTMPADVPRLSSIAIDARVLAVSAAAALSTGLLFGLLPALQFSRPNLTHALADGGRSATAGCRPPASAQRARGRRGRSGGGAARRIRRSSCRALPVSWRSISASTMNAC